MFDSRFLWAFFFVVLLTFILLLFYGQKYLGHDVLTDSTNISESNEESSSPPNELTNKKE